MAAQTRPFKKIHFTGGRFDENAGFLDVDVLRELEFYRKLLVAVACEKWRQENPGQEQLPRGFSDSFRLGIDLLGIGRVASGSCIAEIQRVASPTLVHSEDRFDKAAQVIDETLLAIHNNKPFPDGLTTSVLPMFAKWCKTLRPDESLVLGENDKDFPTYNTDIREQLLARIPRDQPYIDYVDLSGEVRAVDLKNQTSGSFRIKLDSGDVVSGVFSSEQQSSITEALHGHDTLRFRLTGQGRFDLSGKLQKILYVDNHEVIPVGEIPFDPAALSILEMFDQIHNSMLEGELEELPSDGAANYKHYLYGWPKED